MQQLRKYSAYTRNDKRLRFSSHRECLLEMAEWSGVARCTIECSLATACDTELGKEVIQPHLPVRLPCYDLTPVTEFTLGASSATSGAPSSHGLTGGVYKARERIHRSVLICDY